MKKILFLMLIGISVLAQAQGVIRGTIIDDKTGETLIGANVTVKENPAMGAITDLDGTYSIDKVPAGTYTLEISYIGYQNFTVNSVEVKDGNTTLIDIRMKDETAELSEVVVESKALRNNESSLQTLQRKSANLMDGISAQTFKSMGDGDAGAAMKRVTGVSVQNGKYIYVRGLGDRYTKSTLNGMDLPGVDPDKNAVQLDLFPTNIIDNIIVYKTFTPNLPGNFTGGLVDITTKDFPDHKTLSVSFGYGYNPVAHFNKNTLSYKGGKTDWLGFDDGTRKLPVAYNVVTPTPLSANEINTVADISKKFSDIIAPEHKKFFFDQNYNISYGNQFRLKKENSSIGFIASFTFKNETESYNNGVFKLNNLTDFADSAKALTIEQNFTDNKTTNSTTWSALVNTSYKINAKNSIGLTLFHTQASENTTRQLSGGITFNSEYPNYSTSALVYEQRSLSIGLLSGRHVFGKRKMEIEWKSSQELSLLKRPDSRYFSYLYKTNGSETDYVINNTNIPFPYRFWRNMNEFSTDNKVDFTLPFTIKKYTSKFITGVEYNYKNRKYNEYRFDYKKGTEDFYGDPNLYISHDSLISTENINGIYIRNNYQAINNYSANLSLAAYYAMVDLQLHEKFRMIAGARMEYAQIKMTSEEASQNLNNKTILKNIDVLPSLALTYMATKNMNVRLSYARTLARPSFRESAPITVFEFEGGYRFIGNPDLKRTIIDNVDLRWEYFLKNGQLFSASFFYKNFNNPIEVVSIAPLDPQLQYRNVNKAIVLGAEVEIKKNLSFISKKLEGLFIGVNASYIYSKVNIDAEELKIIRQTDPDAPDTRTLFGQSNFLVNTYIEYTHPKGTKLNLNYNVQGPRLVGVLLGATPDLYEQPVHLLNFKGSQDFGKKKQFTIALQAQNLINPWVKITQQFKGTEYTHRAYKRGQTISFSFTYNIK